MSHEYKFKNCKNMKRRLTVLFALLVCLVGSVQAQLSKTVELTEAGALEAQLGEDVGKITELIVKGPLNEADFVTMKEKMKSIQVLDMGGVTELPFETRWVDGTNVSFSVIPHSAFEGKLTLQKVVFPPVVELISGFSFSSCPSLMTLDFSLAKNLKHIEQRSFTSCSNLKYLDLSECTNLKSLSGFSGCGNLLTVNLSGCSQLEIIEGSDWAEGDGCFAFCISLTEVILDGCSSLKQIAGNAFFYDNNLSNFDFYSIPSLEIIGANAFSNTNISGKITFGEKLIKICRSAFEGCKKIESINVSSCRNLQAIEAGAFYNCNIKSVDLTNCLQLNDISGINIGSLEELKIDNIYFKSINGVLFNAEVNILMGYLETKKDAEYVIPSSVISIDCFFNNNNIKKLIIPESVKSINSHFNCVNLAIYMKSSDPIGLSNNLSENNDMQIYVPKGAGKAYRNAPIWKDYAIMEEGEANIVSVTLDAEGSLESKLNNKNIRLNEITELIVAGLMNDNDIRVIGRMANVTRIDLRETNLKHFYLLEDKKYLNLEEILLPKSLIEIQNITGLYSPESLKNVNFSELENLKMINNRAFEETALVNVDFSNTKLEYIGDNAFSKCKIVSPISFPVTLNYLGTFVFGSATPEYIKLTSKEKVSCGENAFASADFENCKLYVPKGKKPEYQSDAEWGKFKNIIEFGQLVKVTSNDHGGCYEIKGDGFCEQGETVSLLVLEISSVGNDIYLFDGWYENDKKVSSEMGYSFVMGNDDRAFKAHFTHVEYTSPEKGHINVEHNTKTVKLKFVMPDDADIEFAGWYEGSTLLTKDMELILNAGLQDKRTIEARISTIQMNLTLSNPTPTYGSVSQSGKGVYKLGDKVTLTASPFVGYKFDGWYEGETLLSTSLVYEMTITKQKMTVEAKFSADDKKPSLVIGTGDETEGGLVVVKGLAVPGQQITVQAIPEEGFAFEGWYLNGQLIETAGMTYSLFVDKEMKTLVAKFRELPFLLDVNGGEKGWAEVILYRGSTIFLKAKQVSGYIFKGWYYGDNLLSDKYEFKLDVSLLRAAVKTLRAVYVTGAVGNETIQAMPVRISRQGNMLILHSDEPVSQVQIYSFRGTLLLQHDGFVQDLRMEVPEGSLIVRIKTEKDEFIVRKIK